MIYIALNTTVDRWVYPDGYIKKYSSIHLQVENEKHKTLAIKTFRDVTPSQMARAVALQNKLAIMQSGERQ